MANKEQTAQIDRRALDLVGGQQGGKVKALSGFKKGFHHVPSEVDDYTQAFVAKIATHEVEAEATELFTAVKACFRYKRREISLEIEGATAAILTKDFDLRLTYAQDPDDPTAFIVEYVLGHIRAADVLQNEVFGAILSRHFDEMRFHVARQIDLVALIDAVEALERDDIHLTYPPDCSDVMLRPEGRTWCFQLTETSLSVVHDRPASPGEMLSFLDETEIIIHESGLRRYLPD